MAFVAVAVTAQAGLVAAASVPAAAVPAAGPSVTAPEGAPTESAAVAAAARFGTAVEVEGARTEYGRTFARPDGTLLLRENLRPQHVRRADGLWVPVDPTLKRNADGTISPVASTLDMRFSGGGTSAFATLTDGDKAMSLTWSDALPAPELSGDTATYRDIRPGVDLQVRADLDSFTHYLIYQSPAAARGAGLSRIEFGTRLRGVSMRVDKGTGAVSAVDAAGATIFGGPTPTMFEAREPAAAPDPKEGAGTQRRAAEATQPAMSPVKAEVAEGKLTLIPDAKMLADPNTIFPVYVDPTWSKATGTRSAWTALLQAYPTSSFYNATSITGTDKYTGPARAGYSDWTGEIHRDRSLFNMNIAKVKNKHIYKATFSITQAWSGGACGYKGATNVQLRSVASFDARTTWNTGWNSSKSGWYEVLASSSAIHRVGESCGTKLIQFNVTNKVAQLASQAQNNMMLGLMAQNENDRYSWKRYLIDPSISIEYNTNPNAPKNLSVANKGCATGSSAPYVTTQTPTFKAETSDPDAPQAMKTVFHAWETGTDRARAAQLHVTHGNPQTVESAALGSNLLFDGKRYSYQAQTFDDTGDNTWSETCEFRADFVAPPVPARVASASSYVEYSGSPTDAGKGGVGVEGVFNAVDPSNAGDVAAYAYTLDSGVTANQATEKGREADGQTEIRVTPRTDKLNVLKVWARDAAGQYSAPVTFQFMVRSGSGPAASWNFDDTAAAGADATGHGNALAFTSATTMTGRAGQGRALSLNGTPGQAATSGPARQPHPDTAGTTVTVRTDGSFTASGWAYLTDLSGTPQQSIIAQDGTRRSIFALTFSGGDQRWRWLVSNGDTDTASSPTILSDAVPVLDKWTHVAGVFDATTKQTRMYVNGVLQSTTGTMTTPYNATGPVVLGRGKWAGNSDAFFKGGLDDVELYPYTLSPTAIAELARPRKPTITLLNGTGPVQVGGTVRAMFDAGGDKNITAFRYSTGTAVLDKSVAAGTPGGTATVDIPATTAGTLAIYAAARNDGNINSTPQQVSVAVVGKPTLTGVVIDNTRNTTVSGAAVTLVSMNEGSTVHLTTISAADGRYSFIGIPAGDYTVNATFGGGCGLIFTTEVDILNATEMPLMLAPLGDKGGYGCLTMGSGESPYPPGATALALTGDNAVTSVTLPFAFPYYGETYTTAWVDTNGYLALKDPGGSQPNRAASIPSAAPPNALIAPYWSDLVVDASASIRTLTLTDPFPEFSSLTVEWRNVQLAADTSKRVSFTATLFGDGTVHFNYQGLSDTVRKGETATVGMESPGGEMGLEYSYQSASLSDDVVIGFLPPILEVPRQTLPLSGTVTDASTGAPAAGVTVLLEPAGLTATTAANGAYTFADLEVGQYTVTAQPETRCGKTASADIDLSGDPVDLRLAYYTDEYGNTCQADTRAFVRAAHQLQVEGDDKVATIGLDFDVTLYGQKYRTAWIDTNGVVSFAELQDSAWDHGGIPSPAGQNRANAAVYPFWNDWIVDEQAGVFTETLGSGTARTLVVEWRNVRSWNDASVRVSFEVIFEEATGDIVITWADIAGTDEEKGATGTVGIENADGSAAITYTYLDPILANGDAVRFHSGPPPVGAITGVVTCAGTPLAGVPVVAGGRSTTTVADGSYTLASVLGDHYSVVATPAGGACYGSAVAQTTVASSDTQRADFALTASTGTRYTVTTGARAYVVADQTVLDLRGDDASAEIVLPFDAQLYGQAYRTGYVDTDGVLSFAAPDGTSWNVGPIPSEAAPNTPNAALYPFWNDWKVDEDSSVRTAHLGAGTATERFVVEWRDVLSWHDNVSRATFEVIIHKTGDIEYVWQTVPFTFVSQGGTGTVGLENVNGTVALQYSYRNPVIRGGQGLLLRPVTG